MMGEKTQMKARSKSASKEKHRTNTLEAKSYF